MTEIAGQLENTITNFGVRNTVVMLALLFIVLFWAVSRLYGWHGLAKHYSGTNRYRGEWIREPDDQENALVVYFNNSESENTIRLGADREGLYLAMSPVFRLFHPPLFIPWNDVISVAVADAPWLKKKNRVRFTFARYPKAPLDVDSYVAKEIEKRAGGRWTMPELG